MREVKPTKSEALALAEERKLMRDGFGFLDEKRMLLAGELLRQLKRYDHCVADLEAARKAGSEALARALERHGLDELQSSQVSPAPEPLPAPALRRVQFLGVPLLEAGEARREAWPASGERPLDPSPELLAARGAFRTYAQLAKELALLAGNLARLSREYRRTERRAKALENVLLPEVGEALKHVTEQLDAMDQEEALRARLSSKGHI